MFTKNTVLTVGAVALVVGAIFGALVFGGSTPDIPESASGSPITTDLRNNVYIDGTTIKTTPEEAIDWQFGDATFARTASFSSSATFGSSGTAITGIFSGTCDFVGMDGSQTATTSSAYDCAVTGVQAGDVVILGTPTTTPTTFEGWRVLGASASSTAGYITAYWYNGTGADGVPSATSVGSSTPYTVISTQ